MNMPALLARRLRLPLICAPMFRVSGPELVVAACRSGIIGAFPTANCASVAELGTWLAHLRSEIGPDDAPFCANLIMRRASLSDELACLIDHGVELVIASVGAPDAIIEPLHRIGCRVFADVATLRHARRAVAAGADGLVLLTAGAGGQTGWANGFSFARAVRDFYDGTVVLAGGISDGHALWAARALGCDLGYMGTRFIATHESQADPAHKQMLVHGEFDDVLLTSAFTGLETNMLRPSIVAAGLDPANLPEDLGQAGAAMLFGPGGGGPRRWRDIWSAGHSISGVRGICSVADLVDEIQRAYETARARSLQQ